MLVKENLDVTPLNQGFAQDAGLCAAPSSSSRTKCQEAKRRTAVGLPESGKRRTSGCRLSAPAAGVVEDRGGIVSQ